MSVGELATSAFEALARGATVEASLAARAHEGVSVPLLGLAALALGSSRGRVGEATRAGIETLRARPDWARARHLLQHASKEHPLPLLRRAADAALVLQIDEAEGRRALSLMGPAAWDGVSADRLGTMYEALCMVRAERAANGRISVTPSLTRRRAGSHYTPRSIADTIARQTLGPLVRDRSVSAILALRICDPAMGAGAFLLAACRVLGEAIGGEGGVATAAASCIRGVDRDPVAVELAGASVWIETGHELREGVLVAGDALLDESLDWEASFPEVFAREGFDAFVGNPPWISFVGRAAQPIDPEHKKKLATRYEAFAGYRNLQGVFIERCARLLKPGGRMGLLVPSSMSEQAGYAPTRRAHDRACECDQGLPDLGDSFEGVFQPCMALLSTKRPSPIAPAPEPWPVERPDMDAMASAMVGKMSLRPLPAHLFGERGLQSVGEDRDHMADERDPCHAVPLRAGGDIAAFRRGAPSRFADAAWFGRRLRSASEFSSVGVLIRQTARVPTACLSDGSAFRNSILAGFADDDYPAEFLVAYLNATPIRWLHYTRHRDARQGMPQVKVGHLRSLPAPPHRELVTELAEIGRMLSARNTGANTEEQSHVDSRVADAFDLDCEERDRIQAWSRSLR